MEDECNRLWREFISKYKPVKITDVNKKDITPVIAPLPRDYFPIEPRFLEPPRIIISNKNT